MPPYSLLNRLWTSGRNSGVPPNAAVSNGGEMNFTAESSQQDYESEEMRQIAIEPERMDMGQILDPAIQLTDGARAGSGQTDFMELHQYREQDHNYGESRRFGNEEELMEASRMIDGDDQLAIDADGNEAILQTGYRDQNRHRYAGKMQHGAREADYMAVDPIFNIGQKFKNEAARGDVASMEVDYNEDEELRRSVSSTETFNSTYQLTNRVESHNGGPSDRDFTCNGGQMQQLDGHIEHGDTRQMFNLPDQSMNVAAPGKATYIKQEQEIEPGAPFNDELPYSFGMPAYGAQPGKYQTDLSDPRFLGQGAHIADLDYGSATQGVKHSQHGAKYFDPRSYQGAQNLGHGYGSSSQHGTTSKLNFNHPSANAPPHSTKMRPVGLHQPPKALDPPREMNASGHAHIVKPVSRSAPSSANDDPTDSDTSDSSDDEPLQDRMKRRTAAAALDITNTATKSKDESASIKFDFKLPTHEAIYERDGKGRASAKVSLPGLVRESVLLSSEHSEHEHRLFLDVFLPSHLARPTPDPEPALAVLNFHTIANLVIETYDQLVVQEKQNLEDLDTDDIFFQIIDRWRVGSPEKETYRLVRGVQEFCDVGLDLVFWVKEHGIWTLPPKERKERCDKGLKRGPKAESMDTGKGAKKDAGTAARKVNELQARKKEPVKAKAKGKEKAKPGPKPKARLGRPPKKVAKKNSVGGVTVLTGRVQKNKK